MSQTIACIVGARPNFVKMGPIIAGLRDADPELRPLLVHTGQHYDRRMSDLFFEELSLPEPNVHLEVGSGTQASQTAKILEKYERYLLDLDRLPTATLVVGDVNSTIACALASIKLGVPVIHVEAGLRSFDRSMPEEINRVVTDSIAGLLLVSEPGGIENLLREGHSRDSIRFVGNVMIDVLMQRLDEAQKSHPVGNWGVTPENYAVWTMHRPSNVDDESLLSKWCDAILHIAVRIPIVFPVHPRTQARMRAIGKWEELESSSNVKLLPPLSYLEFLSLTSQCRLAMTDSGGLQEETSALNKPCLTLRENTERPITVSEGTSTLVGRDIEKLLQLTSDVMSGRYKTAVNQSLWDGRAGKRIGCETVQFLRQIAR